MRESANTNTATATESTELLDSVARALDQLRRRRSGKLDASDVDTDSMEEFRDFLARGRSIGTEDAAVTAVRLLLDFSSERPLQTDDGYSDLDLFLGLRGLEDNWTDRALRLEALTGISYDKWTHAPHRDRFTRESARELIAWMWAKRTRPSPEPPMALPESDDRPTLIEPAGPFHPLGPKTGGRVRAEFVGLLESMMIPYASGELVPTMENVASSLNHLASLLTIDQAQRAFESTSNKAPEMSFTWVSEVRAIAIDEPATASSRRFDGLEITLRGRLGGTVDTVRIQTPGLTTFDMSVLCRAWATCGQDLVGFFEQLSPDLGSARLPRVWIAWLDKCICSLSNSAEWHELSAEEPAARNYPLLNQRCPVHGSVVQWLGDTSTSASYWLRHRH